MVIFSDPLNSMRLSQAAVAPPRLCLSYLFVTETCAPQAAHVVRVLERVGGQVAPPLRALADAHVEGREASSVRPLCDFLKAYGHCRSVVAGGRPQGEQISFLHFLLFVTVF